MHNIKFNNCRTEEDSFQHVLQTFLLLYAITSLILNCTQYWAWYLQGHKQQSI